MNRRLLAVVTLVSWLVLLTHTGLAGQAAKARLPNVTILATGGTIAGTGATSTTIVGYAVATVGVQAEAVEALAA